MALYRKEKSHQSGTEWIASSSLLFAASMLPRSLCGRGKASMPVGPQDHLALQAGGKVGAAQSCKSRANGKGGRDRAAEPHVGLKSCTIGG